MCGHEYVCLYVASVQQQECGKGIMLCWRANILQVEMLCYLTECGEPYSIMLAPLALIYKRGDPHCVPLSLEGLREATTRKPHRICSTWRTCESALTKYAHAKELTDFDGLQDRGACFSPRLLTKNGSVHMWLGWRHTPSSPSSWGCCHDQLCWIMKSIMALWVSACRTKVHFTR
jgi:hypothetical protein